MSALPLLHWAPDPVALRLGPLSIHWYGLCWLASFLVGQRIAARMFQKMGRPDIDAADLMVWALGGTIIGARLVHCLFYEPDIYLANPLRILAVWEGGLASHGGAIGLIVGLWFGLRRIARETGAPLSLLTLIDVAAIPAALGSALIRGANFINSEILGKPTDGSWGVVFDRIDAVPRHPVQLYEAATYLVILAVLVALYRSGRARPGTGVLTGSYLLLVFIARFILEFWKTPQASFEAGNPVMMGQWLSVPFVAIGAVLLARGWRRATTTQNGAGQRRPNQPDSVGPK